MDTEYLCRFTDEELVNELNKRSTCMVFAMSRANDGGMQQLLHATKYPENNPWMGLGLLEYVKIQLLQHIQLTNLKTFGKE